jgi:hypothetical protein
MPPIWMAMEAMLANPAERVGGKGPRAGIDLVADLGQVEVADEFIEDDPFAKDRAHDLAILPGDADEPGERRVDPTERRLEGAVGLDACDGEHRRQDPVGGCDDGGEGDEHGEHVDRELHAIGSTVAEGVEPVDGLTFDAGVGARPRFGGLSLRQHDLGDEEGSWGGPHG